MNRSNQKSQKNVDEGDGDTDRHGDCGIYIAKKADTKLHLAGSDPQAARSEGCYYYYMVGGGDQSHCRALFPARGRTARRAQLGGGRRANCLAVPLWNL